MMRRAQSQDASLVWLLAIVAVLCVFPVLSMSLSQYFDTREGVSYRCIMDDYQGDVVASDTALVEAHVTAFPAGRLCVWEGAEGGRVEHQSGWMFTVIGMIGTALGLVVTIALLCTVGSARGRWAAVLPFIAMAGFWILVISYGVSAPPYIR